jgi:chemotaxis protein methyltransferase CheR
MPALRLDRRAVASPGHPVKELRMATEHGPAAGEDSFRVPDRTQHLLRDLVAAETGMYYDDGRLHFMRDRLTPLAVARGFDSLLDYYYLLRYDDNEAPREWIRAVDALSVQETYFWREADQIEALVSHIVPSLVALGRSRIRIWSLPCSTGEEPLTIAMALDQGGWFDRLDVDLHASDASEAALTRARAGRYGERAFRQLSPALRERYFTATGRSEWTVDPGLHRRVRSWTRTNAVQPDTWGAAAHADVVFCRNLFIYFESATVERVVRAFADRMGSPGYLCVAAAESLLRLSTPFELKTCGGAFVYVKS